MTFDGLATGYDQQFTHTPIARGLRDRVHTRLAARFPPGARALELGCGTGEDARWLAARGVHVTATDNSHAMLAIARTKHDGSSVTFARLDLHHLPQDPLFNTTFRGAFANFGVINVLDEWRSLAAWLAVRVEPGGAAAFGVMARWCLWETAWHGAHGDRRTAFRRWSGQSTFAPPDTPPISIHYPTIRQLTRAFAPYFQRAHVEPLGVFLPPSDVYGVIERRPSLLRALTAIDWRAGRWPPLANLADHYWIEFVRR